jgi:hypothetical protein
MDTIRGRRNRIEKGKIEIWSVYRQEWTPAAHATDEEIAALPRDDRDQAIRAREYAREQARDAADENWIRR